MGRTWVLLGAKSIIDRLKTVHRVHPEVEGANTSHMIRFEIGTDNHYGFGQNISYRNWRRNAEKCMKWKWSIIIRRRHIPYHPFYIFVVAVRNLRYAIELMRESNGDFLLFLQEIGPCTTIFHNSYHANFCVKSTHLHDKYVETQAYFIYWWQYKSYLSCCFSRSGGRD